MYFTSLFLVRNFKYKCICL